MGRISGNVFIGENSFACASARAVRLLTDGLLLLAGLVWKAVSFLFELFRDFAAKLCHTVSFVVSQIVILFEAKRGRQETKEKEVDSQTLHQAATIIQRHVRGFLARAQFLPLSAKELCRFECQRLGSLLERVDVSRSDCEDGGFSSINQKVFLSERVPSVIIKIIDTRRGSRWQNMQLVRKVVRENGLRCIKLPRASLFQKRYIVEEKLNIDDDPYHNLALYEYNREAFDCVVREMVLFQALLGMSDVVSGRHHPCCVVTRDMVRYDNIPLQLFFDSKGRLKARICLLDVEFLDVRKGVVKRDLAFIKHLTTLSRIFPYHSDLIIREANKLLLAGNDVLCADEVAEIEEAACKGRLSMEGNISNHVSWLTERGELEETPPVIFRTLENDKERRILVCLFAKICREELLRIEALIKDCEFEKWMRNLDAEQENFSQNVDLDAASFQMTELVVDYVLETLKKLRKGIVDDAVSDLGYPGVREGRLIKSRTLCFYKPFAQESFIKKSLDLGFNFKEFLSGERFYCMQSICTRILSLFFDFLKEKRGLICSIIDDGDRWILKI